MLPARSVPISAVVLLFVLGRVVLLLTTTTTPTVVTLPASIIETISSFGMKDRHTFVTNLSTTLCDGFCQDNCTDYSTPIASCYSPQQSFPNDPSWGEYDIFDQIIATEQQRDGKTMRVMTSLHRTFFASQNGTCDDVPTDDFVVPLNVCVGPFGQPRPWGTLSVVVPPFPPSHQT